MKYLLTIIFSALLLTGCSGGKKVHFTQEGASFNEKPRIVNSKLFDQQWSFNTGSGYEANDNILTPAFEAGIGYTASVDGTITAVDIESGNIVWRTDLDSNLSAGVGVGDGLLIVATGSGEVLALDQSNGSKVWSAKVNSEVLATPAVAQGVVVVRVGDAIILGLDSATGNQLWDIEKSLSAMSIRGVSTPLINGRGAVIGLADGRLMALDIDTGDTLWETAVGSPRGSNEIRRLSDIDADPVLLGTVLYVASYQSRVVAMAMGSPRIVWSKDISTLKTPGVDSDYLYISDEVGSLVALNRYSGEFVWEQDNLKGRGLSSPLAVGDKLLVGDYEGNLYHLDRRTGHIQSKQSVGGGAILLGPMRVGNHVVVLSENGKLSGFRIEG